jgi:hypothetical protein
MEWEIKESREQCGDIIVDNDTFKILCGYQIEPGKYPLCQQSTCPKRITEKACTWKYHNGRKYRYYKTQCENQFEDDEMDRDNYLYCVFCGGKIIIQPEE